MTAAWPRIKAWLGTARRGVRWSQGDDPTSRGKWELNPVVVKELRQAVRSWAVTGTLLLFLIVLFGTALVMLVSSTVQTYANKRLGSDIFQAFLVILATASLGFIPLYLGVRLALERQENNLDLLYITTLTPGRVIRGKFFCGAYMAVLFFSACMPFMAFCSLLRGVDLPSIFMVLACLFLLVCAMNQVAIFLACLPVSRPFRILLALGGIGLCISTIFPVAFISFQMMRLGIGAMMSTRGFWSGFAVSVGLIFAAVLLMYFLSVALISPASANRAKPPRIYLTLLWILGAAGSFVAMHRLADARVLLPWSIVSFLILAVALLVVISSHDALSLRVQRQIPASGLRRAWAFLMFNGTAGGLVWALGLLLMTYLVTMYYQFHPPSGWASLGKVGDEDFDVFCAASTATVLYTVAYALTALFLHRKFGGKSQPKIAGVIAVLMASLWALLPNINLFFGGRISEHTLERLQLGNIYSVFLVNSHSHRMHHIWFALSWMILALALNARWFVSGWKAFRPLARLESREPAGPPRPAVAP